MNDLQWIGMPLSLAGAWLVGAIQPERRQIGFWLFMASNTIWALFALSLGAWGLLITQALFAVTSIRGIRANRRSDR